MGSASPVRAEAKPPLPGHVLIPVIVCEEGPDHVGTSHQRTPGCCLHCRGELVLTGTWAVAAHHVHCLVHCREPGSRLPPACLCPIPVQTSPHTLYSILLYPCVFHFTPCTTPLCNATPLQSSTLIPHTPSPCVPVPYPLSLCPTPMHPFTPPLHSHTPHPHAPHTTPCSCTPAPCPLSPHIPNALCLTTQTLAVDMVQTLEATNDLPVDLRNRGVRALGQGGAGRSPLLTLKVMVTL